MRWICIFALMLSACLSIGCGGADEKSLTVSVGGTNGDNPPQFEGEYTYLKRGREVSDTISGEGNRANAFRGDKVISAEIEMTGGEGSIRLIISEGMDKVFESEEVDEVGGAIRYDAEEATE